MGQDDQGRTLVRTAQGLLPVTSQALLPAGSEVTLQIRQSSADLLVLIMRVDRYGPGGSAAHPVPTAVPQNGGASGTLTTGTSRLPAQSPSIQPSPLAVNDVVSLERTVRAILQLPADPATLKALGLRLVLPPGGSQLQIKILSADLPETPTSLHPTVRPNAPAPPAPLAGLAKTSPRAQAPLQQAPTGIATGPNDTKTSHNSQLAGAQVRPETTASRTGITADAPASQTKSAATVARSTSDGPLNLGASSGGTQSASAANRGTAQSTAAAHTPSHTPQAPAAAGTVTQTATTLRFTAVVSGNSAQGQPILTTALGTMTLDLKLAIPPGSQLVLELPSASLTTNSVSSSASPWPALEETYQFLQATAAFVGPAALSEKLPAPGPKLSSGLLLFLSALRGGNATNWLGSASQEVLERAGRRDLVERLGQELSTLARTIDAAGGEWRAYMIPLFHDGNLEPLRLFVRERKRDNEHDEPDQKDEATRFVLEVQFVRWGDLQIDGLARRKHLDLILRSRESLPRQIHDDIRLIFNDATTAAGLTGQMTFEVSADWHALTADCSSLDDDSAVVV